MKRFFISGLLLISCTITLVSQHTKELVFPIPASKTDDSYLINTDYPTTGIALKTSTGESFSGCYILVEKDTLYFRVDEESDLSDKTRFSNLMTFSDPIDHFRFYPGNLRDEITFIFIDARMPSDRSAKKLPKKKSASCSEPVMIDQSEWRVGLTEPDYIRIENEVHNLIIHHTAGSNTDDNYFQVVRSIYIYHTETRGWSDIGYNYLIAQDGSIFKGRDPGDLEQDNVLGAHFCSSNTGTMGISILGTYTDIAPPDTAIASLIELLNWKAGKDGLDPIGVFPHPLNDELPVIAGHRDGCSTECPGEMLYTLLNEIRENTLNAFLECGFSVNPIPFHSIPGQDVTVTCTDRGLIVKAGSTFEVEVYTLLGQKVAFTEETLAPDEKIIQINRVSPGNLILVVKGKETYYSGMVFIP